MSQGGLLANMTQMKIIKELFFELSTKGRLLYQMDVKCAFLSDIKNVVYGEHPPGILDHKYKHNGIYTTDSRW